MAERSHKVAAATVNRDISALSKMFTYALGCGEIDAHPLVRFPKLKERPKGFRPITVTEFRLLVQSADHPSIKASLATIGETGIRKGEALSLRWENVDCSKRNLTVECTKDDEPREIPLSNYATQSVSGLMRYLHALPACL